MRMVSRTATLSATPDTLANLATLLAAVTPAVLATARFVQVMIIPIGAGNLAITDDAAATAEAGSPVIPAAGIILGPLGSGQGYIELSRIFVVSATASKAFYLIGISES